MKSMTSHLCKGQSHAQAGALQIVMQCPWRHHSEVFNLAVLAIIGPALPVCT